ncbi:MAG: LysR family transcriptional regulator [Pseudomonadota bacterium]
MFVMVAETLSFTEAAKRLSQPASRVSRRIAELEDGFGVRLFERTTRQVRLTEEGRRLLDRCQSPIEALQEIGGAIVDGTRPTIRVTAPPLAARTTIGPKLLSFAARHPEIMIDLTTTNAELDFVRDNIDLAFRLGPMTDASLIAKRLWLVPYSFCAGRAFAEQHGLRSPISRRQLLAVPAIMSRQAWKLEGGGSIAATNVAHVLDDLAVVLDAVRQNLGIALLPHDMLTDDVVAITVENTLPQMRTMNAVYPSRRLLPARLRTLIDHMAA